MTAEPAPTKEAPTEDRRLTARGEERRRQIVEVATRLFAKDGYHPTSVADVVEAVGVGKGVFYWYFPSKEALLAEILRSRRRRPAAGSSATPSPASTTPSSSMERGIRTGMEWMADHRDLVTLIRFAATEERFTEGLRKGEDIAAADAAAPLARAIDEGRIPEADPDLLARSVVGVTQHLCASLIHADPDSDPTPVIDAAVRFCMGGILGAPSPSAAPELEAHPLAPERRRWRRRPGAPDRRAVGKHHDEAPAGGGFAPDGHLAVPLDRDAHLRRGRGRWRGAGIRRRRRAGRRRPRRTRWAGRPAVRPRR